LYIVYCHPIDILVSPNHNQGNIDNIDVNHNKNSSEFVILMQISARLPLKGMTIMFL